MSVVVVVINEMAMLAAVASCLRASRTELQMLFASSPLVKEPTDRARRSIKGDVALPVAIAEHQTEQLKQRPVFPNERKLFQAD
jgi:hypothetical protein